MNKIALSVLCCAFALAGHPMDNNIGEKTESTEGKKNFKFALDKKVERQLMSVMDMKHLSGKAEVVIQIVEGKASVVNIWGTDEITAGYIRERLNDIEVPQSTRVQGELFRYRILFTREN